MEVPIEKKSSLSDCLFDGALNQGKMVPTMGISALVLDLFCMKLYDSRFKLLVLIFFSKLVRSCRLKACRLVSSRV